MVVHSDHGFSLGRHGRWSKYSLYEESARIPLLLVVPGVSGDRAVHNLVEGIDILPTLLDLWGVRRTTIGSELHQATFMLGTREQSLDGESLLPLMRTEAITDGGAIDADVVEAGAVGNTAGASGRASTRWPKWYVRSELHENFRRNQLVEELAGNSALAEKSWRGAQLWVRTARFAYTAYLYLDPENQSVPLVYRLIDETLYDTDRDPGEANNVAYDGDQRATRERLLDICLRDWRVRLRGPRVTSRKVRAAYLRKITMV